MAKLTVTDLTTVKEMDNAIKIYTTAKDKAKNSSDAAKLQQKIDNCTQSKNKLIGICKYDIKKGNLQITDDNRKEVLRLTRNNYAELSLKAWNTLLYNQDKDEHVNGEIKKDGDLGQIFINFMEGNTGITLMTGVKALIATAAGSLLFKANVFSLIPKAIELAMGVNPVFGACVVALGVAGAALAIKKVFGKEIGKLWGNLKTNHSVKKGVNASKYEFEAQEEIDSELTDNNLHAAECEEEATKLSVTFFKSEAAEKKAVNDFKKKYAGKVSPEFIERALVNAGLQPKALGAVEAYQDLMNENSFHGEKKYTKKTTDAYGTHAKGSTLAADDAHKGFTDFKAEYDKFIKNLDGEKLSPAERRATLKSLHTFASDATKFGSDTSKAEKVQAICNGMVEIASAYLVAIKGNGGAALDPATKKAALQAAGLENVDGLDLDALANK